MKSIAILFSLVPLLALGASLSAQDVREVPSRGKVLILQNERTLEGDIHKIGDHYLIKRGQAEVTIQGSHALRLCVDWTDALRFMKSRAQLGDPDERLRIARWCHVNHLHEQAFSEAQAALQMRPEHRETRMLATIFKRQLDTPPATSVAVVENKTVQQQPLPSLDINSESLSHFVTRVQPILINACANCHSAAQKRPFQIARPFGGNHRAVSQRNLISALSFVNLEKPALSPILVKAVSLHGRLIHAPLKNRKTEAFHTLFTWVHEVVASNPHLAERQWAPPTHAAPVYASPTPDMPERNSLAPTLPEPGILPGNAATRRSNDVKEDNSSFGGGSVVSSSMTRFGTSSAAPSPIGTSPIGTAPVGNSPIGSPKTIFSPADATGTAPSQQSNAAPIDPKGTLSGTGNSKSPPKLNALSYLQQTRTTYKPSFPAPLPPTLAPLASLHPVVGKQGGRQAPSFPTTAGQPIFAETASPLAPVRENTAKPEAGPTSTQPAPMQTPVQTSMTAGNVQASNATQPAASINSEITDGVPQPTGEGFAVSKQTAYRPAFPGGVSMPGARQTPSGVPTSIPGALSPRMLAGTTQGKQPPGLVMAQATPGLPHGLKSPASKQGSSRPPQALPGEIVSGNPNASKAAAHNNPAATAQAPQQQPAVNSNDAYDATPFNLHAHPQRR